MKETLLKLRKKVSVGVVGGSDLKKIAEQIGSQDYLLSNFDYVFAENGLTFYQDGQFKAQAVSRSSTVDVLSLSYSQLTCC